jgi:uncharacterized protein YndB with AHSA1/START domain/uncharacterized protein YciI
MRLLPIRRQLVVPASAETAFAVFTDEIGQWWPVGHGHSVYGAGATVCLRDGVLVETAPDGRESVWGSVLACEPPRLLRLSWHPGRTAERATELDVSFVEVSDGQTLVTLEHRGWERLAEPETARGEYNRGWPFVLGCFATRTSEDASSTVDTDEVWLALMHTGGPALAEGERVFSHPDFGAHLQFLRSLDAEGLLVAAGPVEGSDGMAVLRLRDASQVAEVTRRAQDEDQSVVREVLQVRVRPWRVALVSGILK